MIQDKCGINITAIQCRGSSVFFNTSCRACLIKSRITKTSKAFHAKNVIYFILFGTTGTVGQSCFNQT